LDYRTCLAARSSAEDRKKVEKEKIPCDRYKQPGTRTATQVIEDYQNQITEYENRIQRSETTFVFSMQLNSVGETSIQAMEAALSGVNQQIMRGYEAMGDKSGSGLPTLYNELSTLIAKHCPNKK
jgi:phage-related tail protein